MPATKGPPDLHEGFIEKHFTRDRVTRAVVYDAVIGSLRDAVGAARKLAEQSAASHDAILADPTIPEAARALRAKGTTLKLAEKAAAGIDKALQKAKEEVARLDTSTQAPPAPVDASSVQMEAEIRGALRAMTDEQRGTAIAEAIKNGDDLLIGSYLRGPLILTGARPVEKELHREQWRKTRHPVEADRLARLKKAQEATERSARSLVGFVNSLTQSPSAQLAEAAAKRATDAVEAAKGEAA